MNSLERWKGFYFDVPLNYQDSCVYGFEIKDNIQGNRLFHHTNRQSKKIMASACVTWKGATKVFLVNEKGLKFNSKTYKKHLQKEFLPEVNHIMNNNTWILFKIVHHHIASILFKISWGKNWTISLLNTQNGPHHPQIVILLTTTSGTKKKKKKKCIKIDSTNLSKIQANWKERLKNFGLK